MMGHEKEHIDLLAPDPVVSDPVNHPAHFTGGGIECIEAIEAAGYGSGFCRGNAMKYLWRAGKKDPAKEVEDLKKAAWHLNREIARLEKVEG